MTIELLKNKVISGQPITKEEAMWLVEADVEELCQAADEIRKIFCGSSFDMCAVVSVKGGRCTENCKFCAQSSCSSAEVPSFKVRNEEYVTADALKHSGIGIKHYSQVASGRKLNVNEVEQVCTNTKQIVEKTNLMPCVSLGLLNEEDLEKLKAAGVKRIHNNLETSERYFNEVCSSHTYDEKKKVLRLVKESGLELCSGGIFGIGETWEDRIDLAFEEAKFKPESVPINMLKPVKGTPMGENDIITENEVRRIIAIFRFVLPKSYIRLAAGRDYLEDTGLSCFKSGSNSTITGDMVTVKGISIAQDIKNIQKLGYLLS